MPYKVVFDEDDHIVTVQVSGPATREEHHAAIDHAARLCTEQECKKLLVNLRNLKTEGIATLLDCFEFGTMLAEGAIQKEVYIAYVLPTDETSIRDVQFTFMVAANRGRLAAEFTSQEEARQWLLPKVEE
jgi:hypothetical protein